MGGGGGGEWSTSSKPQLSLSFKIFHNYITKNFLKNAINFVI